MKKNDITYLYDGSFEGLLSTIYQCLFIKMLPNNIVKEEIYNPDLFDNYRYIETNYDHSSKIIKMILNKISDYSYYVIYNAFLSDNNRKEINILYYFMNGLKHGKYINNFKTLNCVLNVLKMSKYVKREAHRLNGFIRFKNTTKNIYYSVIGPTNDVLELVSNHFKYRLKNEYWIIHDINRKKASFYNKKEYIILDTSNVDFTQLNESSGEKDIVSLWKMFIKSVSIEERKNLRCQRTMMPKKYWKYMIELESN